MKLMINLLFSTLFIFNAVTTQAQQWEQLDYMYVGADTSRYAHIMRSFGNDIYCGTDKGLFKSSDNGQTWQNLTFSSGAAQGQDIYSILVATNGDIYTGSYTALYKSTTGGSSWTLLNTLPDSLTYYDLTEINGNIVASYSKNFATGGAYYSNNGGTSWTASTGLGNAPMKHFLIDGSTLYLGGKDGVYKSTDNGQSWDTAGTGFSPGAIWDVAKSGGRFFAGDAVGNGLYGSTDNAQTWMNVDTAIFQGFCQVFSVVEASNKILISLDGSLCNPSGTSPIKISSDTGRTWTTFTDGLPQEGFFPVLGRNTSGSCFFARRGNNGGVFRSCTETGITKIEKEQASISIYPDPFNNAGTLHINNFSALHGKDLQVKIFNTLGEEVKQINQVMEDVKLERGNLPGGIYLCQLKNGGQIIASLKFVIL